MSEGEKKDITELENILDRMITLQTRIIDLLRDAYKILAVDIFF